MIEIKIPFVSCHLQLFSANIICLIIHLTGDDDHLLFILLMDDDNPLSLFI